MAATRLMNAPVLKLPKVLRFCKAPKAFSCCDKMVGASCQPVIDADAVCFGVRTPNVWCQIALTSSGTAWNRSDSSP